MEPKVCKKPEGNSSRTCFLGNVFVAFSCSFKFQVLNLQQQHNDNGEACKFHINFTLMSWRKKNLNFTRKVFQRFFFLLNNEKPEKCAAAIERKKNIARVCESIEWINQIQQIIVYSPDAELEQIKMYAPDSFDAESIKGWIMTIG